MKRSFFPFQQNTANLFKNRLIVSFFGSFIMSNNVRVEIFAAGDGINYPRAGNTVTVHYTGFLPDNSTFDSSRDRKKPFKFKLGADQVIPGTKLCFECFLTNHWLGLDLGVAQLSIGERARMTIPAHLAYGDKGFPGLIPPRTDLAFDIELISFT